MLSRDSFLLSSLACIEKYLKGTQSCPWQTELQLHGKVNTNIVFFFKC